MESRDKQILDLAMEAGKTLLDAGAEIFRAEETIQRIAKAYGIEKSSTFVMSTGIFLTAESKGQDIYAQVKHIPINSARLNRVSAVNQLSREIVEGRYTVEEAWEQLEAIKQMPGKRDFTRILASGVGSASFCYVLGGGIWDAAAAFLSGFLLYVLLVALEKREKKTSKIVLNLLGGLRKYTGWLHYASGTRRLFCKFHPGFCGRRLYRGRCQDAGYPSGSPGHCPWRGAYVYALL